jgi:hypothetical protein
MDMYGNIRFEAFTATEYNELFSLENYAIPTQLIT